MTLIGNIIGVYVLRKYYGTDDEYPNEEIYFYSLLMSHGYTDKLNEPLKGDVWLQKIMHVLSQSINKMNFGFDTYDFGLFSPDLQMILIQNLNSKITEQKNKGGPIYLTAKGSKIAKKLWDGLSEHERKIISNTKSLLNEMTRGELLSYLYSEFPTTIHKSEIIGNFDRKRFNAAKNLFKRQKISLNKASSIAGMSEEKFSRELTKRKIPLHALYMIDFNSSLSYLRNLDKNFPSFTQV